MAGAVQGPNSGCKRNVKACVSAAELYESGADGAMAEDRVTSRAWYSDWAGAQLHTELHTRCRGSCIELTKADG
jgi:hypothetical protein